MFKLLWELLRQWNYVSIWGNFRLFPIDKSFVQSKKNDVEYETLYLKLRLSVSYSSLFELLLFWVLWKVTEYVIMRTMWNMKHFNWNFDWLFHIPVCSNLFSALSSLKRNKKWNFPTKNDWDSKLRPIDLPYPQKIDKIVNRAATVASTEITDLWQFTHFNTVDFLKD